MKNPDWQALTAMALVQVCISAGASPDARQDQLLNKENSMVNPREGDGSGGASLKALQAVENQFFDTVPSCIDDKTLITVLGFPTPEQVIAFSAESQPRQDMTASKPQYSVRDQARDAHGNLSGYSIGPEGTSSRVKVEYDNPSSDRPSISRVQVTRPNGQEQIVFERERSDPHDTNSPFSYSMSRDGSKGNVFFGGFAVASDGRISLYFDKARQSLALSINPETGEEEYPTKKKK